MTGGPAEQTISEARQLVLDGRDASDLLAGALTDMLGGFGPTLALSREMARLRMWDRLKPILHHAMLRYPNSVQLALLDAQFDPNAVARVRDLAVSIGKHRWSVAPVLVEMDEADAALELLQVRDGHPEHRLRDLQAEFDLAIETEQQERASSLIDDLLTLSPDDPETQRRALHLADVTGGPRAVLEMLSSFPKIQVAHLAQVIGHCLASRDLDAAETVFNQLALDGAHSANGLRTSIARIGLASAAAPDVHDWMLENRFDPADRHTDHLLVVRAATEAGPHRYNDARDALLPALRLFPGSVGLRSAAADLAFRSGNWDAALQALAPAEHDTPGQLRALGEASARMAHRQGTNLPGADGPEQIKMAQDSGQTDISEMLFEIVKATSHKSRRTLDRLRLWQAMLTSDLPNSDILTFPLLDDPSLADLAILTRWQWRMGRMQDAKDTRATFIARKSRTVAGWEQAARRDTPDLVLESLSSSSPYSDFPTASALLSRIADMPTTPGRTAGSTHMPNQHCTYWEGPETEPVQRAAEAWQIHLPDWTTSRFDRAAAATFLSQNCPGLIPAFQLAGNPAMRADVFRIGWLLIRGGLYTDLDDLPRKDIRPLIGHADLVLVHEPGFSTIANNFIAAIPDHPLLHCAQRLISGLGSVTGGVDTWMETGPGMMTRAFGQLFKERPDALQSPGAKILGWPEYTAHVATGLEFPHKFETDHWRQQAPQVRRSP